MGQITRIVTIVTIVALASCTKSGTTTTLNGDEVGPVLYVNRSRAEVGSSDDFRSLTLEIERQSRGEIPCVHLHRVTPEGLTYTRMALLAEPPDEVGEDFFVVDGMTARSGDVLTGDAELGSAERPPGIAEAYETASEQLRKACEPFNLAERFDQVVATVPIIFIEEIESTP
ncbi:MAG: hypothetical protein HKN03_17455 [Acidimicrobiales bacterium]|jgi:hypothetical protein|nr:hypothetical protein [Acidimicrobiales bacterium]